MDGLTHAPLKQGGMGSDWSEKGWNRSDASHSDTLC